MKKPIKLLFVVLGVGTVFALALFAWSAKAKGEETFHLTNGVEVTPIEVKPDDTLSLLDAKIWKFDVVLPDDASSYNCTLYGYKEGKAVATLGGLGSSPGPGEKLPRHITVAVCMVPTDADFNHAHHVRYSIRAYGAGTYGIFPKPFRTEFSCSWIPEVMPADNLITLMKGRENEGSPLTIESAVALALKIEPIAATH